jgi:hypothetical protein
MEDVELLSQSQMNTIINNHSFDLTKKYIYRDASGKLIYTLGGLNPRIVYGNPGSFTVTFEPKGSSNVIYYKINGQYESRKYNMDSEVLIMNISSSGITSGTGPFTAVVLGPLSNAEAARVDSESLVLKTISGSSDMSNVTENLVLNTTGPNNSTISWSFEPEGIVESNGTIHRPLVGEPAAKITLTATVTNDAAVETRIFNITVLPNNTILLSPDNPPNGQEEVAYTPYTFTAVGVSAGQYSIVSGFIPVGMTLSNQGVLSGKPANNSKGKYIFTIKVTDGVNAGTRQYTLTVIK